MTEAEFTTYLDQIIPDFAKDNVEAGYWAESEALEKSRKAVMDLLPKGIHTPGHHIYVVRDDNNRVGIVWMRAASDTPIKSGFIFDISVDEAQRGKGYGKQTMLLIEETARGMGLAKMGLHVFAKNNIARKLYESLSYEVGSLNMNKNL